MLSCCCSSSAAAIFVSSSLQQRQHLALLLESSYTHSYATECSFPGIHQWSGAWKDNNVIWMEALSFWQSCITRDFTWFNVCICACLGCLGCLLHPTEPPNPLNRLYKYSTYFREHEFCCTHIQDQWVGKPGTHACLWQGKERKLLEHLVKSQQMGSVLYPRPQSEELC